MVKGLTFSRAESNCICVDLNFASKPAEAAVISATVVLKPDSSACFAFNSSSKVLVRRSKVSKEDLELHIFLLC